MCLFQMVTHVMVQTPLTKKNEKRNTLCQKTITMVTVQTLDGTLKRSSMRVVLDCDYDY